MHMMPAQVLCEGCRGGTLGTSSGKSINKGSRGTSTQEADSDVNRSTTAKPCQGVSDCNMLCVCSRGAPRAPQASCHVWWSSHTSHPLMLPAAAMALLHAFTSHLLSPDQKPQGRGMYNLPAPRRAPKPAWGASEWSPGTVPQHLSEMHGQDWAPAK